MTYTIRKMELEDADAIQQIALELNISGTKRRDGFLVAVPSIDVIRASDKAYVSEENQELTGFTLFYTPPAFEQAFGDRLVNKYPGFKLDASAGLDSLLQLKKSPHGRELPCP